MIQALLNEQVTVKRRLSAFGTPFLIWQSLLPWQLLLPWINTTQATVDSFNNPVYGNPTSGAGWNTVYPTMPIRFAFDRKMVEFAATAERIRPVGTVYFPLPYQISQEDRFLTTDGIEYVVVSVQTAYLTANVIDHYECIVDLP